MHVQLTSEAKEYLEKKKGVNTVTIKMVMCGGWSGFSYQPAVAAGEPEPPEKENYDEYLENGVRIFIMRSLQAKKVTVFYRRGLFGLFFGGLSVKVSWS